MFSHWSRPKPNASEGGWVIYSDLQEILLITLGVLIFDRDDAFGDNFDDRGGFDYDDLGLQSIVMIMEMKTTIEVKTEQDLA